MHPEVETYLKEVDKYLTPLPITDRLDILNELRANISAMLEERPVHEVFASLDSPRSLAQGYLGTIVADPTRSTGDRVVALFAFLGLLTLGGLVVLPVLLAVGLSFGLATVLTPVAFIISTMGSLFGFNFPIMMFGFAHLPFIVELPIVIVITVLFAGLTFLCWKGLELYIKAVVKTTKIALH